MSKKAYNLPQEITDALHTDPVDYIAVWWANNAPDEERQAAEERGATPSGAFAFVESVAKKYKKKSAACLPDELTYKLAVIFLRNGSDGDEFVTDAELKAEEAKKAERKAQAEKRKQEAAAKEAKRKANLSPEELAKEEVIEQERKAQAMKEEIRRKEIQAAKEARRARMERAKAIAEEMRKNQLTFDF